MSLSIRLFRPVGIAIALSLAGPALAADQDTGKISRALEKRLGDRLLPDGRYMEMRFYDEEKGKEYDFRVDLAASQGRIVSRWSVTDGIAKQKSYRILGVGAVRFYADTEFNLRSELIVSNHLGAATNSKLLVFGSVELCPGVAFFRDTGFDGGSYTQTVCRPGLGKTYCLTPAESWMGQAKSLRTNRIISELQLYEEAGCRGPSRLYSDAGTGHEVPRIKLTVEDRRRISSFSVKF